MEGFVRYDLRVRPHPRGLALDVRLAGTGRDRFVVDFLRFNARSLGLAPAAPPEPEDR